MIDPSQNENFQSLGCGDEDALNARLRAWTPPPPRADEQGLSFLIPLPGHSATKTFKMREDGKVEVVEYDAGTEFEVAEIGVNSAWDLFRALQATAGSEVESFAIRGAISAAGRAAIAKGGAIYRRSADKWQDAGQQHVEDASSHVFIADVDHWPLPAGIAPTDLMSQADHVAARFAEVEPSFESAALVAQASNSAGQSAVAFSLKLWGWLREPTTTAGLRDWTNAMNAALGSTASGRKALDPKQMRAVQPIYHHNPRFIGMADPMESKRWRYLHRAGGEIELKLPRRAGALGSAPDSARPQVATGPGGERWKARLRAELGISGCYGAIHTAVYAAVAAGASDEEIIAEIRADASDGRKFPSWSAAYVKEKTNPSFLASMIADARQREAERTRRTAAKIAGLRSHLGLAAHGPRTREARAARRQTR